MLDIERELDAVRGALAARQIEYALCGGLAVAVHGFVRATVDITLLVRCEPAGVSEAVEPLGFNCLRKIDASDGDVLKLDLLIATPALDHVWNTRERMEWLTRDLIVISREGLIALNESPMIVRDVGESAQAGTDYSDRSITMRLKRLSQLRHLCLSLAKAKPFPPQTPAKPE
jgi:hypothetical protein